MTMHHPTRHAVEALLPPGTTVDDLSEREVQDLFNSIVRQAEAEAVERPASASAAPGQPDGQPETPQDDPDRDASRR